MSALLGYNVSVASLAFLTWNMVTNGRPEGRAQTCNCSHTHTYTHRRNKKKSSKVLLIHYKLYKTLDGPSPYITDTTTKLIQLPKLHLAMLTATVAHSCLLLRYYPNADISFKSTWSEFVEAWCRGVYWLLYFLHEWLRKTSCCWISEMSGLPKNHLLKSWNIHQNAFWATVETEDDICSLNTR